MMTKLERQYFNWLFNIVCNNRELRYEFKKLMLCLYSIPFEWVIPMDENRAYDGIDLRYRYTNDIFKDEEFKDCSVLEMLVALAIRCEESFMLDPNKGDRTSEWFWDMIINLGLIRYTDDNFDESEVLDKVYIFLDREYEANGAGGLFTIPDCVYDLRKIDIWTQLGWWISYISDEEG